jgi:hypothetical protein
MGARLVFKYNESYYIYSDLYVRISKSIANLDLCMIYPLDNGLVIALNKRNQLGRLFHREFKKLSYDQAKKINAELIVNDIIKPVLDIAYKEKILNDNKQELDNTIYIISQDKIHQIIGDFFVIEATDFLSGGAEEGIIYTTYMTHLELDPYALCNVVNRNLFKLINTIEKNYIVYDVKNKSYLFFGEDFK